MNMLYEYRIAQFLILSRLFGMRNGHDRRRATGNDKGKLSDKNVKKDIEEKITGYAIDKFSLPRYHLKSLALK
mgnify:CR=1 FL=1